MTEEINILNFLFRIQSIKSANILNKHNLTASSSSFSSLTESIDYEQTEDIELLPQLKPRLLMQISHQLQN